MTAVTGARWLGSALGWDICGDSRDGPHPCILNVGGKTYMTFRETLERYPASRLWQIIEAQGHDIIIDRDPETFRHVLNFLREGRLGAPPADPGEREQLIREAEFYGIPELAKELRDAPLAAPAAAAVLQPGGSPLAAAAPSPADGAPAAPAALCLRWSPGRDDPVATKVTLTPSMPGFLEVKPASTRSDVLVGGGGKVLDFDEAVCLLLGAGYAVAGWQRWAGAGGREAHHVFFTLKGR